MQNKSDTDTDTVHIPYHRYTFLISSYVCIFFRCHSSDIFNYLFISGIHPLKINDNEKQENINPMICKKEHITAIRDDDQHSEIANLQEIIKVYRR